MCDAGYHQYLLCVMQAIISIRYVCCKLSSVSVMCDAGYHQYPLWLVMQAIISIRYV